MQTAEEAYVEGFVTKCAELGVDPNALVKAAAPTIKNLFNVERGSDTLGARHSTGIANSEWKNIIHTDQADELRMLGKTKVGKLTLAKLLRGFK